MLVEGMKMYQQCRAGQMGKAEAPALRRHVRREEQPGEEGH
jgi:hypothetical protein